MHGVISVYWRATHGDNRGIQERAAANRGFAGERERVGGYRVLSRCSVRTACGTDSGKIDEGQAAPRHARDRRLTVRIAVIEILERSHFEPPLHFFVIPANTATDNKIRQSRFFKSSAIATHLPHCAYVSLSWLAACAAMTLANASSSSRCRRSNIPPVVRIRGVETGPRYQPSPR